MSESETTTNQLPADAPTGPTGEPLPGDPEKDPENWVTGDEKMTGPQASYLQTLCREAGEDFDPELTKAQASVEIERLQDVTDRG